ncbi:TetR family transcriptional regulator [Actinophytocola sp.]|uniref:TetR/AcrR family transcriptional regulator n=1 Tax=Actinophytocola sp. TaxID=1872138 RepID=UPI003D6B378F
MTTPAARSTRGRRVVQSGTRPSGDDREGAILATAERLLGERSLSEISTDDLARGAGISRPTFYFYFPSKDAVLLALLDRVVQEADAALARVPDDLASDPPTYWRGCIAAFHETFRAHRPVALACAQARVTNTEVRELWARVMESWTLLVVEAIEGERARGVAPPGLPARDLAVVLNSMNERVLHATFAQDSPAVAEGDVVDVLLTVWLNAIYQTTTPPPA